MRHKHQGPVDRACPGCLDEANEITAEMNRQAFWRLMMAAFLVALAVGSMLLLSWRLR